MHWGQNEEKYTVPVPKGSTFYYDTETHKKKQHTHATQNLRGQKKDMLRVLWGLKECFLNNMPTELIPEG